jgi:uncharacterized protein YfaS (alpha-2-macroglobulin family)
MKRILIPCLLLLVLAVSFSCHRSKKSQTAPISAYQELISGVTSGQIKRGEPIVIKFANELITKEEKGSEVASSLLSFSPSISGKAVWANASTIVFTPSGLLDWGTEYKGTLKLGKLVKVAKELAELEFTFQTPEKQFVVSNYGLSMSTTTDLAYELKGAVETSDEIEGKEIEEILSANQDGKEMKITWEHLDKSNLHRFLISDIARKEKASTLELEWNGNSIDAKNSKGSEEISIPLLSDFIVSMVRVVNIPDQYIEAVFSDPINASADLRGLVLIDDKAVSKTKIENNVLKVYPDSRLNGLHNFSLHPSIESLSGRKLKGFSKTQLNFGSLKPQVRLLGKGVIVPQGNGLFFPFEAVSLSAVDVRITKIFTNNIHSFLQDNDLNGDWRIQNVGRIIKRAKVDLAHKGAKNLGDWNAFNLDLSTLIDVEPGAIYNVQIGFRKKYSLYECESVTNETDQYIDILEEDNFPDQSYQSVYYNYYGNWEDREEACKQAYFSPDRFVDRNILGSNYGIIAKCDQNKKTYVYLTNLLTANPESGVKISFYDFQNQLLTEGSTDSEGMLAVKTDREPFLLVARKDKQVGYLKIAGGTALSTSNFDVSGRTVEKGIKGFLYGERDVWRPGDSVYVSFILEDKQNNLPNGHPLTLEIYNPRGQFVGKVVRIRNENHIYPFFFNTKPDDPTGNWQLKLKAGTVEFSKSIQVETVKPNRLKVEINFGDKLLTSEKINRGTLSSRWLLGTPARNLHARVDVSFSQYAPTFDQFKQYDFSTPYNNFYGSDLTIFDGNLDAEGNADLQFEFKPNREVGGFLKANFLTKVFETGGDFSINHFSRPFSPYTDYVGLKIDWSYQSWKKLNSDEDHTISVASVDENGKPLSLNNVEVKLYQLDYQWWYDSNEENLASYAGQTYHKPVFETTLNTSGGKSEFKLKANENRWGRHLLLVTSPNGHTCGQVIYFGWSWGRGNQKGDAQMLALITEKESFKVGEDVTVSFPANKEARALITFENGTGIIGQEWVNDLKPFTKYTFKARPEMAPNIYVHVSLIQPHGQTANDLPIRLYGVVPVLVEDPGTRLEPILSLPEEVRPLREFSAKVKEKHGKEMEYTLALVDEGLLDLTNFKTPDPWSSFYAREALGITTYDMYNFVMGSFGSRLESMFAVGGSNSLNDNSKKKAERFKPVVKVLGPFHLSAGSEAVHKIKLPMYVGSVRAMVVTAGERNYGNCEKVLPVREPLMVLATLPRVLSPDETVDLPVTVFAMHNSIKRVKIQISSNEFLKVTGRSDTTINFESIGEKDITFRVKSANKTGVAKIKVEAVSGEEKSFHEIELDIRMPNLPTVESEFKMLKPGEKWQTRIAQFGIEGTNIAKLEATALPPLNLGKRLKYLIQYPHGCVEQTTSSVFPQLYLPKLMEMSEEDQNRISNNIRAGIDRLQRFQTSDGGFCYWPGNNYSERWASCYVGYFLLEAEKAGYLVPSNMKKNWLNYMSKEFLESKYDGYSYYLYEEAYRLYLLALAGEPQISAMNRLRTSSKMNNQTRWMLAGAYALAGMKEAAYLLIDFRKMDPDTPYSECYGSYLRDDGIILQTLIALGEMEQALKKAIEMSKMLSTGEWYSTQTTAYSLVSIANFALKTATDEEIGLRLAVNGDQLNQQSKGKIKTIDIKFNKNGVADLSVENSGKGTIFLNLSNEGVKAGIDTVQSQKGIQLIVKYYDKNWKEVKPELLAQSTDFVAWVAVNNKTAIDVKNIALAQMFPAGWEIVNTRMLEGGDEGHKNSEFDYRDFRDDRVYTYFGLSAYQAKTFLVYLNASYCGSYLLSPVTCEAMYDNSYFAKVAGKRVKVVK